MPDGHVSKMLNVKPCRRTASNKQHLQKNSQHIMKRQELSVNVDTRNHTNHCINVFCNHFLASIMSISNFTLNIWCNKILSDLHHIWPWTPRSTAKYHPFKLIGKSGSNFIKSITFKLKMQNSSSVTSCEIALKWMTQLMACWLTTPSLP